MELHSVDQISGFVQVQSERQKVQTTKADHKTSLCTETCEGGGPAAPVELPHPLVNHYPHGPMSFLAMIVTQQGRDSKQVQDQFHTHYQEQ